MFQKILEFFGLPNDKQCNLVLTSHDRVMEAETAFLLYRTHPKYPPTFKIKWENCIRHKNHWGFHKTNSGREFQ